MFNAIATPFGWVLMTLYEWVHNYGLSLVLIAIIVKVILLPFQMKGKRGQLRQARLQPKLAEIQKKHAANKQKLNEEMAKLYKEEGVNPASGCLWSFIQMPIMIALFYAIRQPLTLMMGVSRDLLEKSGEIFQTLAKVGVNIEDPVFDGFYHEIYIAQEVSRNWQVFQPLNIEGLRPISFDLGILNLAEIPNWQVWTFPWDNAAILVPMLLLFLFPIFSGGAQFVSMAIMRKMNAAGTPEAAGGTMGTVLKFMPLMSVWFGFMFPAALSMYWTIGTILQIGQDVWLTKKYTKILDEEDAEKAVIRKAKEAELEAKRLETERKKAEGLAERNRSTSKRKKQKSDKQDRIEKAAEWEKKNTPEQPVDEKYEPSRVGKRRFARGRAYDPDRFGEGADDEVIEVDEDDIEIIDEDGTIIESDNEEDDVDDDSDEDDDEEYEDDDFEDEDDGDYEDDDEDYDDEDDED